MPNEVLRYRGMKQHFCLHILCIDFAHAAHFVYTTKNAIIDKRTAEGGQNCGSVGVRIVLLLH